MEACLSAQHFPFKITPTGCVYDSGNSTFLSGFSAQDSSFPKKDENVL